MWNIVILIQVRKNAWCNEPGLNMIKISIRVGKRKIWLYLESVLLSKWIMWIITNLRSMSFLFNRVILILVRTDQIDYCMGLYVLCDSHANQNTHNQNRRAVLTPFPGFKRLRWLAFIILFLKLNNPSIWDFLIFPYSSWQFSTRI